MADQMRIRVCLQIGLPLEIKQHIYKSVFLYKHITNILNEQLQAYYNISNNSKAYTCICSVKSYLWKVSLSKVTSIILLTAKETKHLVKQLQLGSGQLNY